MSIPPDHWREILRQNVAEVDGSAGLIDGRGVFIARLRNHDQFVGKPAGNDLGPERRSGLDHPPQRRGQKVLLAYHRSSVARWLIGVGVPTSTCRRPCAARS